MIHKAVGQVSSAMESSQGRDDIRKAPQEDLRDPMAIVPPDPTPPNAHPPRRVPIFDTPFGPDRSSLAEVASRKSNQLPQSPASSEALERVDAQPVRYLGRRIADGAAAPVFDAGAPAAPLVPINGRPSSDRSASFDDRFGSGTSSPPVSAPLSSYQPASVPSSNGSRSDAKDIRVLSSRIAPRDGVGNANFPLPDAPNQFGPLSEFDRPRGIVTGMPMPDYPFPPPIFGLSNQTAASNEDGEDWFSRWIKPLLQQ